MLTATTPAAVKLVAIEVDAAVTNPRTAVVAVVTVTVVLADPLKAPLGADAVNANVIDVYSSPALGVMFVAATATPAVVNVSRVPHHSPRFVFDVRCCVHPEGVV